MMQRRLWRFPSLILLATLVVMLVASGLRFWHLTNNPPAPYWEEVALGYDAYSLLKTGKDHHGTGWPIVAFESFGDWKPSGYFYALIPSIAAFGLSVFAIRLPSVLAGIGIVWVFPHFFTLLLRRKISSGETIWLRFIAAVCPWLLVFSRGGWEVNLATFLLLLGSVAWLKALQPKTAIIRWRWALSAVICFASAAYTYHAMRVIAPLWLIGISLDWLCSLRNKKSLVMKGVGQLCCWATVVTLLLLPILLQLHSKAISQRFQETSIFSDPSSVLTSNQLREEHGNTFLSKMLYHRYRYQTAMILDKVFQHASVNFLFVTGDSNARHRGSMYGQLLYPDALLIAIGIIALTLSKNNRQSLLSWLWLTAVLPASLTTATPHALRSLPSCLILLSVSGCGFFWIKDWLIQHIRPQLLATSLITLFILIYSGFAFLWLRSYSSLYPTQFAADWQYGYAQMITAVQITAKAHADLPIIISRQEGRPAMYWWFYTKTDPQQVQAANSTALKDQGEFLTFSNVRFTSAMGDFQPGNLVALSEAEWGAIQKDHPTWTLTESTTIRRPNQSVVWVVGILK